MRRHTVHSIMHSFKTQYNFVGPKLIDMNFLDSAFTKGNEEKENIWIAASDGDIDRVKELIEEGISVNLQDEAGYSPLHAAASYEQMELIEYLLQVGADVNLRDPDGDTPLLVAESPYVFERLIQAGADPRAKNNSTKGIFDKALEDDNEEFIEYLVSKGYCDDPNFKLEKNGGDGEGEEWWEGANDDIEGGEGEAGEGDNRMDADEENN